VAGEFVEIGAELLAVKQALPHGAFLEWIGAEFGWTDRSAQKYMRIAEAFGKSEVTSDLGVEVLYALSAPDVPETVRGEMVERAKVEPVTLRVVQDRLRSGAASVAPDRRIALDTIVPSPKWQATLARTVARTPVDADPSDVRPAPDPPLLSIVDLETGAVVDDPDLQDEDAPYDQEAERREWIESSVPAAMARVSAYRTDPVALGRLLDYLLGLADPGQEAPFFDAYASEKTVFG